MRSGHSTRAQVRSTATSHTEPELQREREKLKIRPVTYLSITFREQEIWKNTGTSEMLRETRPKCTSAKQPDTRGLLAVLMGWLKPRAIVGWVRLTRNPERIAAARPASRNPRKSRANPINVRRHNASRVDVVATACSRIHSESQPQSTDLTFYLSRRSAATAGRRRNESRGDSLSGLKVVVKSRQR